MCLVGVGPTSPIPRGSRVSSTLIFPRIYPERVTLCPPPEVETLRSCLWEKKPRDVVLIISLLPVMCRNLSASRRYMALRQSCFSKPASQSCPRRIF